MKRMYFTLLVTGFSLFSSLNAASPATADAANPNRIPLGTRKEHVTDDLDGLTLAPKGYDQGPRANWNYYNTVRSVRGVGAHGTTLTQDDQTIWEVAPGSSYIAKQWGPATTYAIYPNNWTIGSWFSQYDYALYNERTGEWVEARLSEGPFTKYAVLTTDIDYNQGYVKLADGSVWKIGANSLDHAKLREWKTRQAVLVGRNTGWFTPNNILININENDFVTANFVGYR